MPKRKKHSGEAMSGQDLYLPPEIWTQILTKLPVKSILRCRHVCKTWYSLISCPNFISDHTAQTLNQSTGDRVLVHRCGNGVEKFTSHDKSFVESHEHHDVPELNLSTGVVEIVGCCDGLICFSRYNHRVIETDGTCSFHSFLIWNPSIRKLVELPLLYLPVSQEVGHLFGFGFDSRSRDYKVVRVLFHKTHGSISSDDAVVAQCDIFDLKKGVWSSSSSPMRPCCYSLPSVYLYGNLHWIGYNCTSTKNALVSFNLSSEVLHEIEMVPDALKLVNGSYTEVLSINGLLSLAVVKTKRQCIVRRHCMPVWSMKEYGVIKSWTKLFNIDIELPCSTVILSLERFWENEVVVVECNKDGSKVLVLYNPESKESKALLSDDLLFDRACFYKESLVLL